MKRKRDFNEMSWLLLFLFTISISISAFESDHQQSMGIGIISPTSRSLMSLPSKRNTALMAALDGTIHLVETNSKRVIWSFRSGPPIYSSYQHHSLFNHSSSNFFIDCGLDWDLYLQTPHFPPMKLSMSIEDYVKSTPYLSDDGAVTLGSKKTTVFEVDPQLGTLIRTYVSSETLTTELVRSESNHQNPRSKPRLQIMRTDYTLKSFVPSSHELSWNMSVSEVVAALLCPQVDDHLPRSSDLLVSTDHIEFDITSELALPLPCQSKAFVFRHRTLQSSQRQGLPTLDDQDKIPDSSTNVRPQIHGEKILSLPTLEDDRDTETESSNVFRWSIASTLALFVGIIIGVVVYRYAIVIKAKLVSSDRQKDINSKPLPSRKKKNRKSEKNSGVVDENDKQVLLDIPGSVAQNDEGGESTRLKMNPLVDPSVEGRRIGRLVVLNAEIAKGSNGTVVFEGIYEGRHVAVKRLVQAHHDIAFKEIQNLIASDHHPNIVRWYGVECDQDFVYLSLEHCTCSLDDLIQIYSNLSQDQALFKNRDAIASTEYKVRLESLKNSMPKVNFWKANGHPSPLLLKLMRDVVLGVAHLHELGIIHRDLKPQNVLIIKERLLCAKLSDMGISKRLLGDMSSLGHHVTGCGSSGWQAPEQLLHGRQTRAVDLFSLGCVLFFCISGGRHPFGHRLERDINIVKNLMDLFFIESMPEATDLISRLLNPDPERRPKALEVLSHPFFWDSETRLSFLRDTSDRVELEDRASSTGLLKALESIAPKALGGTKWDEKLEPIFIVNIGHYRRYKFDSVRDLMRVMRNKLNHYRELPKEIQELVGPLPEGFDGYFATRFPRLLIEVYIIMYRYCKEEECFRKYYRSNV